VTQPVSLAITSAFAGAQGKSVEGLAIRLRELTGFDDKHFLFGKVTEQIVKETTILPNSACSGRLRLASLGSPPLTPPRWAIVGKPLRRFFNASKEERQKERPNFPRKGRRDS